jgi:hypothetical protein
MSEKTLLTAVVAVALVVPLAGQKTKPPKPPVYTLCTIEQEINSGGAQVLVGRDVQTYGPLDQALYIHGSLLPPDGAPDPTGGIARVKKAPLSDGYYGPYHGQVRLLNDRLDYFFDTGTGCLADNTQPTLCPFRLIVVDGTAVYERIGKTRTLVRIAFNEGRYLLDYRPCDPAGDPVNCYVKLYGCYDDRDCPGVPPGGAGYVYASFEARFQQELMSFRRPAAPALRREPGLTSSRVGIRPRVRGTRST